MNMKKTAKVALTATLATTAFVAASPAQAASVSPTEAVATAQVEANKLVPFYTLEAGEFGVTAAFTAQYNKATAAIVAAENLASQSSDRQWFDEQLNYAKELRLRAARIIDANKHVALLEDAKENFEQYLGEEITAETVEAYNALSAEIRTAERAVYRIYGEGNRDIAGEEIIRPAKMAREQLIWEVTAFNLLGEIEADIKAENPVAAADKLELLDRVNARSVAIKEAGKELYGPDAYPTYAKVVSQLNAKQAAAQTAYEGLIAPSVTSVTAVNGKEIVLTFNTAIDKKTLVDADSNNVIKVANGSGATAPGTVTQTLSADGKTLTLKAANYFKGDYTVAVPFEVVKGENGKFLTAVNAKLNVSDKTAPVLTSAKSTIKSTADGIKTITLTFDEDVKSIDNIKIGNANFTPVVEGNTATVSVNLDATKTYDITVVNAQDAAGNVKDLQVSALNVTVDNNAPSITKVEAAGENKVKVTVDKALKNDSLTVTANVGSFVTNIVDSVAVNPKNNKEYIVTLNSSYLFKSGNTDAVTLKVAKEALVDTLGNTNSSEIKNVVTVSKDVAAPAVSNVETKKTDGKVTSFTVTYNEEVKGLDASKVTVTNSKGEILRFSDVVSTVSISESNKVVYTLNDVKADKYSFDLAQGFVTDNSLASNKSAKYSFTVDVTDVSAPVETSFNIAGASVENNVITVDFGVKVKASGTGSALNAAAYQVNGTTLPANTKIEFLTTNNVVDQTQVVITLPNGFVQTTDAKAIFRVTGVQTLDNKVSNAFLKELPVVDNTAPEAKSFIATDLDKLTVTYSEAVALQTGADVTDEIKLFDSKGASVAITASEVVNGKLVLTVADAASVTKLTTVKVEDVNANIVDTNDIAQKTGVTLNK